MAWCPKCRKEYPEGVTECADCNEPLVEALPDELRETARLRLEMPEASLRELAEALGLSRSGVNHRLKRLSQLAGKEQDQ